MTTGKTIALTRQTFVDKVMSLLFNTLSRLVITFLLRSKWLLISWVQSQPAVILEPPQIKSLTVSIVSPSICHEVMGQDAMIFFVFWMLSFKPTFSLSSFTFIKMLFSSLSAIKLVSSACTQYASRFGKTQQWPQDWKRSVFISIPKKGTAKECSNYHTIALISHASKAMLKILQSRL